MDHSSFDHLLRIRQQLRSHELLHLRLREQLLKQQLRLRLLTKRLWHCSFLFNFSSLTQIGPSQKRRFGAFHRKKQGRSENRTALPSVKIVSEKLIQRLRRQDLKAF